MPLTWGIIGAGKIAERQVISAIREADDQRLLAVMRRDLAAARDVAVRHGVPHAHSSADDLLAHPEIDAVFIASPPSSHKDHTIAAAERGKHVLCEKPLAMNPAEAQAMIDACRANDVRFMVCYYQHYNVRHQRVKQLVAAGAIGQVTAARIAFNDLHPPGAGGWHHTPAISGGGPLMDLAPHCLHLVHWLLGPIVDVRAAIATLASDSPVEDTATLLLTLATGCQVVVTTHWSTANFNPDQFNSLDIFGTAGSLHAAPIQAKDSAGSLRLLTAAGPQDFDIPPGGPRPHVGLLNAFAAAVAAHRPTPIPGEDGLADLRVIHAAYEAARTGRAVRLTT